MERSRRECIHIYIRQLKVATLVDDIYTSYSQRRYSTENAAIMVDRLYTDIKAYYLLHISLGEENSGLIHISR